MLDKMGKFALDGLNLDSFHHYMYEPFFESGYYNKSTSSSNSNYPKDSMFDKMDKFDLDGLNLDSFHHYRYEPFFASAY